MSSSFCHSFIPSCTCWRWLVLFKIGHCFTLFACNIQVGDCMWRSVIWALFPSTDVLYLLGFAQFASRRFFLDNLALLLKSVNPYCLESIYCHGCCCLCCYSQLTGVHVKAAGPMICPNCIQTIPLFFNLTQPLFQQFYLVVFLHIKLWMPFSLAS